MKYRHKQRDLWIGRFRASGWASTQPGFMISVSPRIEVDTTNEEYELADVSTSVWLGWFGAGFELAIRRDVED